MPHHEKQLQWVVSDVDDAGRPGPAFVVCGCCSRQLGGSDPFLELGLCCKALASSSDKQLGGDCRQLSTSGERTTDQLGGLTLDAEVDLRVSAAVGLGHDSSLLELASQRGQ